MSTKDRVIELIRALPDGATWEDIVAAGEAQFGPLPEVPGKVVSEAEAEAAWAPIIARRMEEMLSGKVKGIPAEEVLRRSRGPRR